MCNPLVIAGHGPSTSFNTYRNFKSALVRQAKRNHQNSFKTHWYRLYMSLELYWKNDHHSFKRYSFICCFDDGAGEGCLTRHSKISRTSDCEGCDIIFILIKPLSAPLCPIVWGGGGHTGKGHSPQDKGDQNNQNFFAMRLGTKPLWQNVPPNPRLYLDVKSDQCPEIRWMWVATTGHACTNKRA